MKEFSYIWPIALVVLSNIFYHICSKSSPEQMNPFASLTLTYAVGTVVAGALYFILNPGGNLLREYKQANFSPFLLGIVIVGLEAGFIYAYKAGWQVSKATIVQSSFLSIALLVVGLLLYGEKITLNKAIGMGICMLGLIVINYK